MPLSEAVKCLIDNGHWLAAIRLLRTENGFMDGGACYNLSLREAKQAVDKYRYTPKTMADAIKRLTDYVNNSNLTWNLDALTASPHPLGFDLRAQALEALIFIADKTR